jgi:hypothetical protein
VNDLTQSWISDWNAANQTRNAVQQVYVVLRVWIVQIRDDITKKGEDSGDGIKEDDPMFSNISRA